MYIISYRESAQHLIFVFKVWDFEPRLAPFAKVCQGGLYHNSRFWLKIDLSLDL